jgi:DNA-binding NtrC family response regulator
MPTATILLIEDDPHSTRLISWTLIEQGYSVTTVPTPEEALATIDRVNPRVVIFNTAAPEEQRIRDAEELHGRLPVARILDVHDHAVAHCATDVPADAFLHKPFDADDLLGAVDRLTAPPKT